MDWGWFDVDYIEITPSPEDYSYLYEAEQATLENDYRLYSDEEASGSSYIQVKDKTKGYVTTNS